MPRNHTATCTLFRWIAPEVLAGSHYDRAADVYAFGVILWEILTWQVPWDDLGPWQVSTCCTCGIMIAISGCRHCIVFVEFTGCDNTNSCIVKRALKQQNLIARSAACFLVVHDQVCPT